MTKGHRQEDQQVVDRHWMGHALTLAAQAQAIGEVPVGAVLVDTLTNELLAEGFNQPIAHHDPTAHAEIIALRAAAHARHNYRLPHTTLYVTLEPCSMCAGALVHARVDRVVIAAAERRAGAAGSVFNLLDNPNLNHRCAVSFGPGETESQVLLQAFFKSKRDLSGRET